MFTTALANEDKTLGLRRDNPGTSCHEIYQLNPTSRGSIEKYWIHTSEGVFQVTCNMQLKCDGVEGGWMQVVDVDLYRDDNCPGEWHKVTTPIVRTGVKYFTTPGKLCVGYVAGCASANFDVKGVQYQHICGKARAYQKGAPDAFNTQKQSVDDVYVDGISITLGSPRKHVWTYAAGVTDDGDYPKSNCPCATIPGPPQPAFVGDHYYCESGVMGEFEYDEYYQRDALWDGSGCSDGNGCCAQIGMPWFYRKIPVSVQDDLEVRICKNRGHHNEDIGVERLELYVK